MPYAVDPWADPVPVRRPGDFARHPETGAPYVSDPTRMVDAKLKLAELITLCAKLGIDVPDKPRVAQLKALLGTAAMRQTMVPYGRPSSLGKQIENLVNIQKWSERATALGIFLDPDLLAELGGLGEEHLNLDDADTRKLLDDIAVKAKNRAQAGLAAERGTHIHERTEDFDTERDWIEAAQRGEELGLPLEVQTALIAAWDKMLTEYGFEVLAVEKAVVDDAWRQAGTLDRIVRMTRDIRFVTTGGEYVTVPAGTVLILDIKTGRLRLDDKGFVSYWHGYSVQLASYAHSLPYNTSTDTRGEWPFAIAQDYSIIAHLDVLTALNEGVAKCRLVLVDLEAGRYAGEMCVAARQWEKRTDVFSIPTDDLTVSVPVSPAESDAGDTSAGLASRVVSVGEPIASVADPTEEPPTAVVEAAPAADVEFPAGAENFSERRSRLLERHKALSPALKRQFRERRLHPADLDHIQALLDELENPPSIQALAAETSAVGTARDVAHCKSCGAVIRWAVTENDKRIPLDAEPTSGGNLVLVDGVARAPRIGEDDVPFLQYVSHFATCPQADEHRTPKAQDFPSRTPVRSAETLRFAGDEGADVDKRAADDLMEMGRALPEDRQKPIHATAAEAHETVGSFSLKGRLSQRRFDITRALIIWAGTIDWSDELIRACLVAATGDEAIHQPAIPLGVAVGMLDAAEASVFADVTARLARGSMVPDFSGPSPRLVAA
jgi:hypothetical protein